MSMSMSNQSDHSSLARVGVSDEAPPSAQADFSKAASFQPQLDADGFSQGFDLDTEAEQIKQFFNEWGFVVVRDLLPRDDCERTIDEFWSVAANEVAGTARDEPSTWDKFWARQKFGKMGIMGIFEAIDPQLLRNRQNPRLHRLYSLLHGTERLIVDHDRVGVLRPTRGVRMRPDAEPEDKPQWRSIDRWLHVDCNPHFGRIDMASMRRVDDHSAWAEDVPIDFHKTLFVQGLIALCDAREQDGGFQCVPGSHVSGLHSILGPRGMGGNIQVPAEHEIRRYIQRVPLRQGSMVIWNSLTFHANYPNDSDQFRMVQYVRMLPVDYPFVSLMDQYKDCLPPGFDVSELGSKLFGFEPWPGADQDSKSSCVLQ